MKDTGDFGVTRQFRNDSNDRLNVYPALLRCARTDRIILHCSLVYFVAQFSKNARKIFSSANTSWNSHANFTPFAF